MLVGQAFFISIRIGPVHLCREQDKAVTDSETDLDNKNARSTVLFGATQDRSDMQTLLCYKRQESHNSKNKMVWTVPPAS